MEKTGLWMKDLAKPLRLEEKQGFLNRAVQGGLDKFVMNRCDALLLEIPARTGSDRDFRDFLNQVRSSFGQYLSLTPAERKSLLAKTLAGLEIWATRLPGERAAGSLPKTGLGLRDPILSLVPPAKARAFQLTGLKSAEDVLNYTPKWALHKSLFTPVARASGGGDPVFIRARINGVSATQRGPRTTLKVVLQDATGHMVWTWFNRPYLKKELVNGRWVVLHDTPEVSRWGKQVVGRAGAFEFLKDGEAEALEAGKVVVMYPSTPSLDQDFWRQLVGKVWEGAGPSLGDLGLKAPDGAPGLAEAYAQIHHPASLESFEAARKRLAFDQLFTLQLFLLLKKRVIEGRRKGRSYGFEGERILRFRKSVPYALTGAQKKVIREIREDLARPHPMNRLLQGDVGSGKTVVAAVSFLYAADSGIQGALMAPTEILATQHHRTFEKLVGPVGLKSVLLTSDMKAKERREALSALETGQADLAVGTHALLEKDVKFNNLGLVVVDERHKFGVLQRAALEEKGAWPDSLMMTATPFPRALVLTEYGDTDLSLLDEMPKGRVPVKTFWKRGSQKEEVYQFARERVLKGEQAFLVYPVVEESKSFLKSAVQMHKFFKEQTFHGFRVGLLHGKMKKDEKAAVMEAFRNREIQILVSTTVVEVGVDVSNATLMVVEHAERFGLAQLHQLRGRVGRGEAQAYCYLLTGEPLSSDAVERMRAMVSTTDGFKLSETDLKLRGPGEIFGLAQSGRREGGIVDLKRDSAIVEEARNSAQEVLAEDPDLSKPKNAALRDFFQRKYKGQLDLASIS